MAVYTLNNKICTACGDCVSDCARGALELQGKNIKFKIDLCNECGHCFAICPQNALSTNMNREEIIEDDISNNLQDADTFLRFLKQRRSIRQYETKEVEFEKLYKIIEAGRYSPTAGNNQSHQFIIIKEKIDEVRRETIKTLYNIATDESIDLGSSDYYRKIWIRMYTDYIEKKLDRLFFNAPEVIIITSNQKSGNALLNGGIAASRMEIVANYLGLGVCYIGFLKRAADYNKSIYELIGIREDEEFIISFVVGYPKVNYYRSVNRKLANVRII